MVAFFTNPKRQGSHLAMRRSMWVIALIAWFVLIFLVADDRGELIVPVTTYGVGALVGLATREFQHRAAT